MAAKRLDWDSQFLGIEVFGVTLASGNALADLPETIRFLQDSKADLAYFFLPKADTVVREALAGRGAILYDEKITYAKELGPEPPAWPPGVGIYRGGVTQQLLDLAFLAGHESRFKKDPRLTPHFEPLYSLWLTNSLNGAMADCVLVYNPGADREIEGMVTCKLKEDGTGSIGLIAASAANRGAGIGSRLLQASEAWLINNGGTRSTVVTQKSNTGACRFYEKAGFTEYKTEDVYHLWFN